MKTFFAPRAGMVFAAAALILLCACSRSQDTSADWGHIYDGAVSSEGTSGFTQDGFHF